MYGKLKGNEIKTRGAFRENAVAVFVGLFGFALLIVLDNKGIPKKWFTAIMGTLLAFGFVIYARRGTLLRWPFWVSLSICLAVHCIAVWVFFQYVLYDVERFSILFWFPIMLVEVFVLLIVGKRIETRLTGKHETIKLRF